MNDLLVGLNCVWDGGKESERRNWGLEYREFGVLMSLGFIFWIIEIYRKFLS